MIANDTAGQTATVAARNQGRRLFGRPLLGILLVGACAGFTGCGKDAPSTPEETATPDPLVTKGAAFTPLPPTPADPTNRYFESLDAARLGQLLFFSEQLAGNGQVSCATCHAPEHGFSDPRPLSHGMGAATRHAPGLLNAAHHRWFGWGGRADSLWSQALGPLENPREMGGNRVAILRTVFADESMSAGFERIFGNLPDWRSWPADAWPPQADPDGVQPAWAKAWEGMTPDHQAAANNAFANLGKALAAYEGRLRSGPAPFDLAIEARAKEPAAAAQPAPIPGWDASAERGFDLFLGKGRCVVCHSGPLFSDGEFHNTGAPRSDGADPEDPGRFQGGRLLKQGQFRASGPFSDDPTGQQAERTRLLHIQSDQWGAFKTPSLRNLPQRGPYMHQGQFGTLSEVVDFYDTLENSVGASHHQEQILLPIGLTRQEKVDLIRFLHALEGAPAPEEWTRRPD